MTTQIGAQLYTVREHCTNAVDLAATCAKLKDIGFQAVQLSAVKVDDPVEIRKILDDHGLVCAATHQSIEQLQDTQQCLDYHAALDCDLTAIGGFGFDNVTEADWRAFPATYNALARSFADSPLHIGYHNHSHELSPFGLAERPDQIDPCNCPMQVLLDEMDPSIWFEIDTYWIAHGGGDPAEWINLCNGRIPAVHVKDMTVTPSRDQKMCEVGAGNLNWPAILDACRAAGVEWYLIERDDGDLDPFESLRISLENLRSWGIN